MLPRWGYRDAGSCLTGKQEEVQTWKIDIRARTAQSGVTDAIAHARRDSGQKKSQKPSAQRKTKNA